MGMPGTINNDSWRWRNDDGGEEVTTGATWKEAAATSHDFPTGELDANVRLRFDVYILAGDLDAIIPQLQYNLNSSTWIDVNATSIVARSAASGNFADADDTTDHGFTGGYTTFVGTNSGMDEVNGEAGVGTLDLLSTEGIMVEFCFQLREADLADNDSVDFRVVRGTGSTFAVWATANGTIDLPAAGGDVFHENRVDAISHQQQPLTAHKLGGVLVDQIGVAA